MIYPIKPSRNMKWGFGHHLYSPKEALPVPNNALWKHQRAETGNNVVSVSSQVDVSPMSNSVAQKTNQDSHKASPGVNRDWEEVSSGSLETYAKNHDWALCASKLLEDAYPAVGKTWNTSVSKRGRLERFGLLTWLMIVGVKSEKANRGPSL